MSYQTDTHFHKKQLILNLSVSQAAFVRFGAYTKVLSSFLLYFDFLFDSKIISYLLKFVVIPYEMRTVLNLLLFVECAALE